jgi:peptidoglycan/LPS O-acetylase OafA/YrhL
MAANQRPTEIKALAGARALPPLLLVLYHYCEGHSYRGFPAFDILVCKGYLWVEFFFGLSGFILTYVYGSRAPDFLSWTTYSGFLKARLARLYPLHLFMLLFILYLLVTLRFLAHQGGYVSIYDQAYHPMLTFWSFIANLFLVQSWNLFPWLTWNGVAWFVSIEFLLCLLFPVYVSIWRGGVWAGLLLIVVGFSGLVALDFTNTHGLDITFHNGALRGMSDFAIGVGMAVIFVRLKVRESAPWPAYAHSIVQGLVVAALIYAIYHSGWSHQWRDIYLVPPMMALIFALAFDRGWIARIFQTAPLQKIGEWSYAIYLGQTAWLQLIRFIQQRFYPPEDTIVMGYRWPDFIWWLEPIGLVIVCLIWGALLSVFIEEPASKFLRCWFDGAPKARVGAP